LVVVLAQVMNRLALVAAVTLCIAIVAVGIGIYLANNTLSPTPQPIINVTITHFGLHGIINPVGMIWCPIFMLNSTNYGTTDINNVTLTITTNSTYKISREVSLFNSTTHSGTDTFEMGESYSFGNISAGRTQQLDGVFFNELGDSSKLAGSAIVATLKSNGTILDQATIYLQGSQDSSEITCAFHEISSETVGNDTKIILLATAKCNTGNQAILSYDKFHLTPWYTKNDTYHSPLFSNTVVPLETGTITIGRQDTNSTFQLTFQYPTYYQGYPVGGHSFGYSKDSHDSENFIELIHEDLLDCDS